MESVCVQEAPAPLGVGGRVGGQEAAAKAGKERGKERGKEEHGPRTRAPEKKAHSKTQKTKKRR